MTKERTPLWPRFQGKIYKTHHSRSTFGSQNVEKVHSVVARSTFGSEKCKKVTVSDQFLEVRMRFFAWRAQGIPHLTKGEQNVMVL